MPTYNGVRLGVGPAGAAQQETHDGGASLPAR